MTFQRLEAFTKKVSDLADKPALNASELKAQFDAAPEELRQSFNKLVDDLNTLNPVAKKPTGWTALTLQNGWANTSNYETPASYRIDETGFVNFRGSIYGGVITSDTILFQVPAEIRPYFWQRLNALNWDGGVNSKAISLLVHVNGNVSIRGAQWNNFIILDGLRYSIDS